MKRTALKRRKRVNPVNPDRRAREFQRAYGSEERVYYVGQHLACVVPDCHAHECDNAHIETGGMGRKADADKVAPICNPHHRLLHQHGPETFEAAYGVDLEEAAADTESRWRLYGEDVVARAKADGRYDAWLARNTEDA